jgi:hypothetical protein
MATAAIAVGASAIVLWVLIFAIGSAADDDLGDDAVEGERTTFLDIAEGDCLNIPGGTDSVQVATAGKVPCEQPHDFEAYAVIVHPAEPDAEFPGEDTVIGFARDECLARFEGFVGVTYEASELEVSFVYPQETSWTKLDDREVVCGVITIDGSKLTGSMRGTAR